MLLYVGRWLMRKIALHMTWMFAALLAAMPTLVFAQQTPMIHTNRPDVKAFPRPPANFNPMYATEEELNAYGLPARPTDPEAFPIWDMVAGSADQRIIPQFGTSRIKHTPAQPAQGERLQSGVMAGPVQGIVSTNWSGLAIINTNEQNPLPFTNLYGSWIIPGAQIPPGESCPTNAPGNGFYGSDWIGIDGAFVNGNLVQTGTDTFIECNGTAGVVVTMPWWEWIPNAETPITNFGVNPGDGMFGVIRLIDSTHANIFLEDLTTGSSVSFQVTAPPGARVAGQTVEWIHEAVQVGGQISVLPAFGTAVFSVAWSNVPNIIKPLPPGNGNATTLQINLSQNNKTLATAWFGGGASTWIAGRNAEHLLFGN
jgi:hypothetical protein